MNKSELVESISVKANLSKADAERALNALVETVVSNVKKGTKVAVVGLGTFERVSRAARTGINPSTKEPIHIKAKNAPKFKASKTFKDLVA
ncbi:MAG: HU family DNA-binding protein [Mycoplasmatales bacterium]|nr:HU family DNA-binding protein [Mycoplasmatales bacterium]